MNDLPVCNTGRRFSVVCEGRTIGVIARYDDANRVGLYSDLDAARACARQLAVTHPGARYAVVEVLEMVMQTHEQAAALRAEAKRQGSSSFGHLYRAAGISDDIDTRPLSDFT